MTLKEYLNKYAHLLDINQKEFFTKIQDEQVPFSDQIDLAKKIIEAGINLDPSLFTRYENYYLLDNDNNVNKINVNNWKWLLSDLPNFEVNVPLTTAQKKINLLDLQNYYQNNSGLRQLALMNYKHSNQLSLLDQVSINLDYGLENVSVDIHFEDKYGSDFFALSDFDAQVVKDNLLIIPGIGVGMNTSKLKTYIQENCFTGVKIVLELYLWSLKKK